MSSIAVIGSGIAGMSAAWLLNQKHKITVFETEDRIGGHSNTVEAPTGKGDIPVDTGFIVYNEVNYPNLVALFDHLDVPTAPSDMSFSVSLDGGKTEYGSRNTNTVFGQRRNVLSPRFWGMIGDIRRFFATAPEIMEKSDDYRDQSLGQYLSDNAYGPEFINDFILPMGAAIWSTRADEMRDYPVESFVRFFVSHGLLQFGDRIPWRTVNGGSREYVRRLTEPFKDSIQTNRGIAAIKRTDGGVRLTDSKGDNYNFDSVVVACHADQALSLLSDPNERETQLLSAFRYTDNRAILHRDASLMPKRQTVWSSWNYMGATKSGASVTYWMNSLQPLEDPTPIFVSLNPKREPAPETVIEEFSYSHPYFDKAALTAQENLWEIQGRRRTWFCGSYFGYGFHEDALQSGLAAAEEAGDVRRPWTVPQESGRIHTPQTIAKAAE